MFMVQLLFAHLMPGGIKHKLWSIQRRGDAFCLHPVASFTWSGQELGLLVLYLGLGKGLLAAYCCSGVCGGLAVSKWNCELRAKAALSMT